MIMMLQENNVIDNKKIILKDELTKILPKTENASIAVGYFFISGLSAVIHPLKNVNKIRLLISNTTDKITAESLIEGFKNIKEVQIKVDEKNFLNQDRKDEVIFDSEKNIKESIEYMRQTSDDKLIIESLIKMMKSKQLEVRVYPKEKLHAKAYIFQPKDKDFTQGMGIVGSSNLSLAGLSQNSELNLKTYNAPDVNQLLKWFDELWQISLEFTDKFNVILKTSWAGKIYSPRDVFLKAVYLEYGDKLEGQYKIDPIWRTTFPNLFKFQLDAVKLGYTMFELYGGVIIGDVVGLGKTYVGIALLKYLQLKGHRSLIICPPHLIQMWEKFCEDYKVDAKVLSRGILSQEGFELYRDYKYTNRDLVLIDESHHFRNNNSRQYENLHQFVQAKNAKVILLTATPFSNTSADIKNQIMLFHQTPQTLIPPANETDLDKYFNQVKKGEANLVDLLQNIMIRRTRRYVISQWGQKDENGKKYLQVGGEKKYFPKRKMLTERYDINIVYQKKYKKIIKYLDENNLTFARYSVGLYLKNDYKHVELYKGLGVAGKKLVGLIRTLLLKRMESSLEAFKISIGHYIDTHRIFLKLLEEKIIPVGDVSYKSMADIAQSDPDSINEPKTIEEFRKKIHESHEIKYAFEAFDVNRLILDIQNDIKIFETIKELIHDLTWKNDDKLCRLQRLLDNNYSNKKILIFSEFTTTAKYLNKHLKWSGIKEQVDSTTINPIQYAQRFDPNNNPGSTKIEKSKEISLLIATDVFAEGINLQAGEVVINYDFHWNPTRLIQRAGRVDRIGSKNESIIVYNFLLDLEMENDFGLEQTVDNKINNIQKIIGEEHKILKETEKINTEDNFAIYGGDESFLDRENGNILEPSKFEKILQNIQIHDPIFWDKLKKKPNGIRSFISTKSSGRLLLACQSGIDKSSRIRKYYLIKSQNEIQEIKISRALKILDSSDEKIYPAPSNYDKLVAIGWKRFIEDIDQISARTSDIKLNSTQRWIIEKLMKMDKTEKFSDKKEIIETLRIAYSIPIIRGKLNRELKQIMQSGMNNYELINNLSQLYLHYELQNHVKQNKIENKSPRILYSGYIDE